MYHPQVYEKQLRVAFHKLVFFYQIYMSALYTINYILRNQTGCAYVWLQIHTQPLKQTEATNQLCKSFAHATSNLLERASLLII
jgi:hypothetical protein